MVLGFSSPICTQQRQTLRGFQLSSGVSPIHRTRGCTVRHLRVAQSFDAPSVKDTAAEHATQLDTTASPAETVVEADPQHLQTPVPEDVLSEFEHKLEADLQSVAVTLTAVTGVIIFWRGVWSLLDTLMGDSLFGDICCIIVGLTIVMGIRLSGVKVANSFWPPS